MKKIIRYRIEEDYDGYLVYEDKDGEWIKYEDVKEECKECEFIGNSDIIIDDSNNILNLYECDHSQRQWYKIENNIVIRDINTDMFCFTSKKKFQTPFISCTIWFKDSGNRDSEYRRIFTFDKISWSEGIVLEKFHQEYIYNGYSDKLIKDFYIVNLNYCSDDYTKQYVVENKPVISNEVRYNNKGECIQQNVEFIDSGKLLTKNNLNEILQNNFNKIDENHIGKRLFVRKDRYENLIS